MAYRIRVLVAFVVIVALTGMFLGLTAWPLTQIEFIPALLAADAVIIAVILALTAVFGRVYCAVLCPLGIFQDFLFWCKKKIRKQHVRFSYEPERRLLRYGVAAVLLVAWVVGLAFVPALVDPYSIYGRMVTNLLTPVWQNGFNAAAGISENYILLAKYDIVFQGLTALGIAVAYFLVLTVLAWRYGRLYCNAFCPVGTLLGTISRFSFLHVAIDEENCVACGRCEQQCRSACIDVKNHVVDHSRCVLCLECLKNCPKKAIHYSRGLKKVAGAQTGAVPAPGTLLSRRAMLVTAGIAVGTAAAGVARSANSVAVLTGPTDTADLPVMPPGAGAMKHFLQQCTACHLCIDRCPEQVLKPAGLAYGLGGIGKPMMDYTRGYCNFNCTLCGDICQNDAIHALTLKAKQGTNIGMAMFDAQQCLITREGVVCGNCAIHCPAGAITMEADGDKKVPRVHRRKCIGCGSCEYHCPASPKAMRVAGKK